ncbi:MAG: hypothetical protein AAGB18_02160 [Pseudomonadota bacterium]
MFAVLLLGAMVETHEMGIRPMACTFPGRTYNEETIEVVLTPKPSLKDLPGLYRVEMAVNGTFKMSASAQPITATDTRDVIVRASGDGTAIYTIGFDAGGNAAFNVMMAGEGNSDPLEATRAGYCQNYERALERWSMF